MYEDQQQQQQQQQNLYMGNSSACGSLAGLLE
jgi:hypothetical protein